MIGLEPGLQTSIQHTESPDAAAVKARHLPGKGVWVLTACVGSGALRERAAARAEEAFARELLAEQASRDATGLCRAIAAANAVLYDDEQPQSASPTFATSIVSVVAGSERFLVGHLGNARCYLFRAGERSLLTRPHTAVVELGGDDERSAFATHHRHLLTRALGIGAAVDPDIVEHDPRPGDVLMLVNDELSWAVEDQAVKALIASGAHLEVVTSHVVDLGKRAGLHGALISMVIGAPTESAAAGLN